MVVLAPSAVVRAKAIQELREAGIQTSMHYPCVSDFEAFRIWRTDAVGHSRDFAKRAITLPIFPTLTKDQVEKVVAIIKSHI